MMDQKPIEYEMIYSVRVLIREGVEMKRNFSDLVGRIIDQAIESAAW